MCAVYLARLCWFQLFIRAEKCLHFANTQYPCTVGVLNTTLYNVVHAPLFTILYILSTDWMLTSMIAIVRVHGPMNECVPHQQNWKRTKDARSCTLAYSTNTIFTSSNNKMMRQSKANGAKKKIYAYIVAPRSRWKRYYLFSRIYSISFRERSHCVGVGCSFAREYSCYFIACGSFFADSHYGIGFHYHCHFRIRFEYLEIVFIYATLSLNSPRPTLVTRYTLQCYHIRPDHTNCHSTLCVTMVYTICRFDDIASGQQCYRIDSKTDIPIVHRVKIHL